MTDEITFKKDGWIATIILNRPHKLNAVTPLGGLAFLAGWLCLIIGVLQG